MPLRLLAVSTLFPNANQPRHGIFVENQLREMRRHSDAEIKVLAPVPWFPLSGSLFGRYAKYADVPQSERRHGIEVWHPRYLVIPKIGMSLAPLLLAGGALNTVYRIREEGFDFDVLDAHYFYPDGIAAVLLGRLVKRPVTITARGSDINIIGSYAIPRTWIRWAGRHSRRMVAVCRDLAERMVEIGLEPGKMGTLPPAVDLKTFRPYDRVAVRKRLGLGGFTVLSVGNLIELKGHHLIIEALKELPDVTLLVAGDGPMENALRRLASSMGVGERVHFLGLLPHVDLPHYYSAADCLVLASSSEGSANVLLESMACGTPVAATGVGGTPEIVASPECGVLIHSRTVRGIANGIRELRRAYPDRARTRAYAERFDVETRAAYLSSLLREAAGDLADA